MIWRFIDSGKQDPYLNMAIDEAILLICEENESFTPTLRIYCWEKPTVTIGINQDYREINYKFCEEVNIPIIRRITGGKSIYHENDLTFSIAIKKIALPLGLLQSYKILNSGFIFAFKFLGIDAEWTCEKKFLKKSSFCFATSIKYEIAVGGKKILGAAQRRLKDSVLEQGSVPISLNREVCSKIIKEEIVDIVTVSEISKNVSFSDLKEAVLEGFKKALKIDFKKEDLSLKELKLAEKLKKEKYLNLNWNYKREWKDEGKIYI